jgi:hypothetical protein
LAGNLKTNSNTIINELMQAFLVGLGVLGIGVVSIAQVIFESTQAYPSAKN